MTAANGSHPPVPPDLWVGTVAGMEDDDIITRIDALVDQEHHLHTRSSAGEALSEDEKDALRQLEVRLDQCWDLLRQRRARRHAGQDPDAAAARPVDVVERYQQ